MAMEVQFFTLYSCSASISMQGGFMRFGAKHNDIYPILSDMIRWATGLPSRRAE